MGLWVTHAGFVAGRLVVWQVFSGGGGEVALGVGRLSVL